MQRRIGQTTLLVSSAQWRWSTSMTVENAPQAKSPTARRPPPLRGKREMSHRKQRTTISLGAGLVIEAPSCYAQPKTPISAPTDTDRKMNQRAPSEGDCGLSSSCTTLVADTTQVRSLATEANRLMTTIREASQPNNKYRQSGASPSLTVSGNNALVLSGNNIAKHITSPASLLIYNPQRRRDVVTSCSAIRSMLLELKRTSAATGRLQTDQCSPEDCSNLWQSIGALSSVLSQHSSDSGVDVRNLYSLVHKSIEPLFNELIGRTAEVMDLFTVDQTVEILLQVSKVSQLAAEGRRRGAARDDDVAFAPDSFVTRASVHMTKLLDKAQAVVDPTVARQFLKFSGLLRLPGHFQLHALYHRLLPTALPAIAETKDVRELVALVNGLAKYSVSGAALDVVMKLLQDEDITKLMTLKDITSMLRSMRTVGTKNAGGSSVGQRSHGDEYQHPQSVSRKAKTLDGVAEDYFSLITALCNRAATLLTKDTLQFRDAPSEALERISVSEVCSFYINHCHLEYPTWGEMYPFFCSAVCEYGGLSSSESTTTPLVTITAATDKAAVDNGQVTAQLDSVPATAMPLAAIDDRTVVAMIRAILHRNTAVPHHALHELLTKRLRLMTDAFLSASPPELTKIDGDLEPADLISLLLITTHLMSPGTSGEPTQRAVFATALRRYGKRLTKPGFVAALCEADLASLPEPSRANVVQHFTSISSSLSGFWYLKGLTALFEQIPASCDDVSVAKWMSRFADGALHSFVKSIDLSTAANLLVLIHNVEVRSSTKVQDTSVVSQPSLSNSLAKRAVVMHVCAKCARATTHEIAVVCDALVSSRLLLAHAFSRLCRSLLSNLNGSEESLLGLLRAFRSLAEGFTSVQYKGTVFADVWELLRSRVIQDSSSMSLEEVVEAFNAFAVLDVRDRAVFQCLLLQLWAMVGFTPSAAADDMNLRGDEVSPVHPAHQTLSQVIGTLLSPASRVVILWLVATGGLRPDACQLLLTSLMMHTTQPAVIEALYPDSITQVLSTTLKLLTPECSATLGLSRLDIHALHVAHDCARELFLLMYGDEAKEQRATWSPKARRSVMLSADVYLDIVLSLGSAGLLDEALFVAAWNRIPSKMLIIRNRNRKDDTASLLATPSELVLLCIAACEQFSPLMDAAGSAAVPLRQKTSPPTTTSVPTVEVTVATESTILSEHAPAPGGELTLQHTQQCERKATRARILRPILDAVLARMEEITLHDVLALRRCLTAHFGSKVDDDFLAALASQEAMLRERSHSSTSTGAEQSTSAPANGLSRSGGPDVEDLFY